MPRRGGGVALYVKSLLMSTRLVINATSPCVEMVGCQFSLPSRHITVKLVNRSPCSTESDDDIVLRVFRTVARLRRECLILEDFNALHVNWLTRSCSMANSFSNKLRTAADEEFLHQAVTSPTRYKAGQVPSILNLVFSKYSSSIHSINHLTLLDKSDHATLQVYFTASDLPAGNISKAKWCYNKANVQGFLCAANSID